MTPAHPMPHVALSIAGSDSGGGAGIGADLKTFGAFGVFGTCAITAVTAQNTCGVTGVHVLPADFVIAQVEAVLGDLDVVAVKTGMLANAEIINAVAGLAAAGRLPQLVVDPVMVSSSGDRLLDASAESSYLDALLPHAVVFTPNVREAEVLLGVSIRSLDCQRDAARALGAYGPAVVVVKGGHQVADHTDQAIDAVWDGHNVYELSGPWVQTPNNHGTGCSFASAIAASLADSIEVIDAIHIAKTYVARALAGAASWRLGSGHGPLDHFVDHNP